MSKVRTHYDNLQVKENASDEVIKGAYRYLSQKWHPDKNQHNREEAERVLRIINQAYATLSDPIKRKEHDEWIESQREDTDNPEQSSPPHTEQQRKEERTGATITAVRPWVRFWARTIDLYLFCIVVGLSIGFLYPELFVGEMNDQVLGSIIIFTWIFAESIFLSSMGTTPEKWILNTKIEHHSSRISFGNALSRSFKVWLRGMGIGIPLVSIITNLVAYSKLTKNGETTWDSEDGFTVTHERIGVVRVIVAAMIVSIFMLFVVAGNA